MTKKIYIVLILLITFHFYTSGQVQIKKSEDGLLFTEKGNNILFYQKEPQNKDGKYERCNYIHPLWGIDGEVVTEDFPEDHLHQRGVFWAWHQIWIDGKRIGDGWEIKDFEQQVVDVEFISKEKGAALLKTEVLWKSDLWQKNGIKSPYLKENTDITIYPQKENYRRIDFKISLLALEENLLIGGSEDIKGYSGFSVRMILPEDIKFSGAEGEVEPLNEAVESPGFVNISGSIGKNNGRAGILIVDHPVNPDYPQPWILRKKKSMQNAVFPGREPVSVSTSQPLILKYSLIVYSGSLRDKKIEKILKNSDNLDR